MWHAWGTYTVLVGKHDQRRPLGRWMHRRDDNNIMDFNLYRTKVTSAVTQVKV
jgi:hypothetical protein